MNDADRAALLRALERGLDLGGHGRLIGPRAALVADATTTADEAALRRALDGVVQEIVRGHEPARPPAEWLALAGEVVRALARAREPFTSDDVWEALEARDAGPPPEPRALGTVMRAAAEAGEIRKTGRSVPSRLGRNHRRPVAVWEPTGQVRLDTPA